MNAPPEPPPDGLPILPGSPPEKDQLFREFSSLADTRVLFGADVNSEILKKSESGAKFLVREPPSQAKLLSMWNFHFGNRIPPVSLLSLLARTIQGIGHRDSLLLFAKDRIVYDTRIVHGPEPIGEMTLSFRAETERGEGFLGFFHARTLRVVHIENISLRQQNSGYASALFRWYEELFGKLGFHQFRLKASLSVGKYYWAKEGFDCLDETGIAGMKERLAALVRSKELPVRKWEVDRLTHVSDIALFRKDLKIPAYRDPEGYYAIEKDPEHSEEVLLPVGKAFLLTSEPWDGFKVISTGTPRRTGFVYSDRFLEHRTPKGHVEDPRRLETLLKTIDRNGLRDSLLFLKPYPVDPEILAQVHDAGYLDAFRAAAERGDAWFESRDCMVSRETHGVALLAAGGVMAGVDAVLNRRAENVFCAVRPPGHHATRNAAMGFCFVNNVAVGAVYARAAYGIERIFILDWDVHHGNGTQELFEEDPRTFFCSLHEHPTFCFPGTGRRMETGKGAGAGATLNLPLRPHTEDFELIDIFDREVIPRIDRFRPELILISAGFDGHADDPIADLELTERSYEHMTRRICEAADRHCGGRIVSVLEGGYNRPVFASCAVAHIRALQGRT